MSEPLEEKDWLSMAEVAAWMGVHVATIRRAVKTKRIPSATLSRRCIKLHRDTVKEFFTKPQPKKTKQ